MIWCMEPGTSLHSFASLENSRRNSYKSSRKQCLSLPFKWETESTYIRCLVTAYYCTQQMWNRTCHKQHWCHKKWLGGSHRVTFDGLNSQTTWVTNLWWQRQGFGALINENINSSLDEDGNGLLQLCNDSCRWECTWILYNKRQACKSWLWNLRSTFYPCTWSSVFFIWSNLVSMWFMRAEPMKNVTGPLGSGYCPMWGMSLRYVSVHRCTQEALLGFNSTTMDMGKAWHCCSWLGPSWFCWGQPVHQAVALAQWHLHFPWRKREKEKTVGNTKQ